MKLTIDFELNAGSFGSLDLNAVAHSAFLTLLAKSQVRWCDDPLESLVSQQFGLAAAPDYPIAAIAGAVDGLHINHGYWLRADPVHLVLQRDCFSLGEPLPLLVNTHDATMFIESLNQHFAQDGLLFVLGATGAWYVHNEHDTSIKTTLPQTVAGKNVHHFMPQGDQAAKWLSVLNEAQMLLHEHPANTMRELNGDLAVNSIWLSGGGKQPKSLVLQTDVDTIVANNTFYQGLAALANIDFMPLPNKQDDFFQVAQQQKIQHLRLQIPPITRLDDIWFTLVFRAMKQKIIKQLTINIGVYEKTLIAEMGSLDTYKFWRKIKPLAHYLI